MIPLITMLAGQAVSNQKTRAWGRGIVSFETVNPCEPFLEQPGAVVNPNFPPQPRHSNDFASQNPLQFPAWVEPQNVA
jgi:hypothetical protein